uniref:Sperm-associated antigen 17 n=1 Tax=Clytia hemisphaerica TaxID=252671 RepID=A0A7M5X1M2_9CNID
MAWSLSTTLTRRFEILSAHGDIYHSTPYQTPEQKIPPTTVMPINTVAVEPAKIEDTPSRNTPSRGKKGSGSASKQQQNTSLQPESITEPTNETENESNNNNEKKKFPLSWNVTKGLSGEKWFIDSSGHEEFVENMMIADASCFESNQVLQTREDGVIIVNRENGTSIVEYLDGTRITMATKTRVDHVVNQETGESREVEAQYQEVLVEHEFYPTTIIDLNKSSIQCEFPNGRAITGFQDGGYVVAQQQDKQMIVSTSGELYIHPKRSIDISQSDIPCSKGTCVMKQTTQNALQIIDHQGNQFEVDADGSYRVQKGQHSHDEDVSSEIKPRYFVVHSDGSGEELLRYEDVCHYLQEAESNPSAAILHGGLEGDEEATTLTVLKPHSGYVEDIWRPSKKESNIIPISLRERDFKAYDSRINEARKKSAWPGSDKPVKLGPWVPPKSSPQITCPETLEVRHLINYKELTAENRKEIIEGINQYGEYIAKQQDDVEKLRNIDDRSEEEKIKAQRIKEHFLHQEASKSTDAEKMIADQYLDALRPPKPPSPKRAQTERASEEWERDKQELRDLGYHKYMLRTEDFPPYFLTEQGQRFLRENPSPDMKMLSDRLAEESKHPTTSSRADSIPSSQGSITPHDKIPVSSSTPHQEDSSFLIEDPSSSMSMKNDYSINSISPYDSSTSGRPLNPTPQRAKNTSFTKNSVPLLESKLDPITESNFTEQPSSMNESSKGMLSRSLMYDVAGSPRKGSVKTPSSILGSRPNAIPNEKFTNIEDPVRRQSKTASVYGSVDPESTSKLRGFILLPDVVDFGVLTEGYSYTHQVTMKNVGIDSCRYKIKQPPLSTGLKIIYQPGQVAAGMQVTFDVEIFAVAVGVESGSCGIGQISHHVEIISETDILYLPVIATIITQDELQHPSEMTPQGGPSKGTLILDKRPSSREMLRSRKE